MAVFKTNVKGLVLTLDPQVGTAGNVSTLTGMTLLLTIKDPDNATKITRVPAASSDGKTASYTTDGTEFPVAGIYSLDLDVSSAGVDLVSATATITITARL